MKLFKTIGMFLAASLVMSNLTFVAHAENEEATTTTYIYEDFSSNQGGWQKGISYSTNVPTVTVADGKLTMTGTTPDADRNREPHINHLINNGEGIKAEKGKNVVLKTRFVVDSGNYTYLKINRPTELEDLPNDLVRYNYYSVFGFNYGGINYMDGNDATTKQPVETQVTGMRNKWIDLKIVFKPNAEGTAFEKADYYVTVNGDDYKAANVTLPSTERESGFTDWTAIRNVTFAQKGGTNTTSIDYFELFESYENYVSEDFDVYMHEWQKGLAYSDTKLDFSVSDGILTMTGTSPAVDNNKEPHINHLIKGGEGIKAEKGKNVVLSTKFRTENKSNFTYLKINRPATWDGLAKDMVKNKYYTVFEVYYGCIYYMSGNNAETKEPVKYEIDGLRDAWIDLKIVFKPNAEGTAFEKADYYVKFNGNEYKYSDITLPAAERESGFTDWSAIRNVTFAQKGNSTNTTSIDYFRLYEESYTDAEILEPRRFDNKPIEIKFNKDAKISGNIESVTLKNSNNETVETINTLEGNILKITPVAELPLGDYTVDISGLNFIGEPLNLNTNKVSVLEDEGAIYEDFSADQGKWKKGIAYSTNIPTVTVSDGILTMTGSSPDNDRNREPHINRLINSGDGIKAEKGKNVVLSTKFIVDSGNNTYLKINRPTELEDLPNDLVRYNYYSVFGFYWGNVYYMDGNDAENKGPVMNEITGVRGKWVDLKIVFKPNAEGTAFEKADYYVNADGVEYKYYDKTLPTADRESGFTDWTAIRNVSFTLKGDTTTSIDYFNLYTVPATDDLSLINYGGKDGAADKYMAVASYKNTAAETKNLLLVLAEYEEVGGVKELVNVETVKFAATPGETFVVDTDILNPASGNIVKAFFWEETTGKPVLTMENN